ncbi:XRE family transcriptional regulator [Rhizobium sp. SEMIA 4085]|uniref:Transcriptional regulator protein n=1 Tax=Rhizobium gallicum bv. gallicum R602sp TaxID=1041138 RepID=A0A0B4X5I0_9HYPH|nr:MULTISPECIES: XRE family transcriptional regulator [Rhizobium]AJD41808.1 transcriptional regulator protein [Rhizobium gallicum bv. gallicum R602sp]NNH33418.1 XRE family transcriptional regulator [Rhizobium sp. SEMIA 4085]
MLNVTGSIRRFVTAIGPIGNDADLAWAIGENTPYFGAPQATGCAEADRADVLSDLIEAYESRLSLYLHGHADRTQADLGDVLGSRARAFEILHRMRALTVEMIVKLNEAWAIPAGCLGKPYKLAVA